MVLKCDKKKYIYISNEKKTHNQTKEHERKGAKIKKKSKSLTTLKGIVSDSNKMILWHESEDINKQSLFPKFQLLPILRFQVMHDYV